MSLFSFAILLSSASVGAFNQFMDRDLDALMNEEPAAAFLGLTRRALQNFRLNGKGPQYVKLGERCVLETHKRMETHAELIDRNNELQRAIKALQFDEANRRVSERDVERYPDGQSYGESQLESMKQTQHALMHLSDQTHRLRRRELNVEEAREALKLT